MSEKERLQLENECLMKYSKAQMIQKYIDELEESSKLSELWCKSQEENRKLKEDISFCLHSIKQEMEMSTDSRTRSEMTSCYEILKRWNK